MSLALATGYLFTAVAILIASPFNGLLAEKAEEIITGQEVQGPETIAQAFMIFPRAIGRELVKFAYYLPLLLIVILSWSVFWMKDENFAGRTRVSSTGILTIVAYQFAIGNTLPRVPYLTFMDEVMIVSFTLIGVTVVESLLVANAKEQGDTATALRIDRTCRWLFPLVYGAILCVLAMRHLW